MANINQDERLEDYGPIDALGGVPPNMYQIFQCVGIIHKWDRYLPRRVVRHSAPSYYYGSITRTNTKWTIDLPVEVWRIILSYIDKGCNRQLELHLMMYFTSACPRPMHYVYNRIPSVKVFQDTINAFAYWRIGSPMQTNMAGKRCEVSRNIIRAHHLWKYPNIPEYDIDMAIPPVQYQGSKEPSSKPYSPCYLVTRVYHDAGSFEILITTGYCTDKDGKPCSGGCNSRKGKVPVNHRFYRFSVDYTQNLTSCCVSVAKVPCALVASQIRTSNTRTHISNVRFTRIYCRRAADHSINFGSWRDMKDIDTTPTHDPINAPFPPVTASLVPPSL